jgi:carboxyl-terminal processing protease
MKSQKRAVFLLLAGYLLFWSVFTSLSVQAATFSDLKDVPLTDPRIGMMTDLVNAKALTLDTAGNFRPAERINKAAFLKAALSYLGYTPLKTLNNFTGYSDVPENSWFAPYVKKALEMRIFSNTLNEKFYPEQPLTRQEALVMLVRIYGLPVPLSTPVAKDLYKDIRTTHPLAYVYASAKNHNLYFEKDQEYFRPTLTLTRGDAADILFKAKLASQIIYGNRPMVTVTEVTATPGSVLTQSEQDLLENEKFGILLDAWSKINEQYIYTQNYTQDKLIYGAITGMVDSLNDPYSTFKTPEADGDSYIYVPESYEGIGAVIEQTDGQFIVLTTINNSPAYRAGLKSKDIILEIDGKTLGNLSYEQVLALIKGQAGTIVRLKVKRDQTTLNFEIIREKITIEAIQRKVVGTNINYLRIDQFTDSSSDEFNQNLEAIQTSGSKKLIIDLRNNPGGYLDSTQKILGHFLTSGQVEFYTEDRQQQRSSYTSTGKGELKDYRVVVLVNEGSASASEIFAAALQDYQLARIIGTTTFGKGSVQEITSYSDNSSLKLTIAKWLTPKLRELNHVGVTPDQTVKITDLQRQSGQDPQLDAAIQYLK